MDKGDLETKYWDMITRHASRDYRIQGVVKWILFGHEGPLVPYAPELDYGDIVAQIREDYGLSPEQVQLAFQISEEDILRSLAHGQA